MTYGSVPIAANVIDERKKPISIFKKFIAP